MKTIIALLLGLMFAVNASADCNEMYKKYKIKQVPAAALSTTGGVALGGAAYYSFAVGTVIAVLTSQNAFMVSGIALGLGVSAGGVIVSVRGVKHGVEFIRKARAYNLIKESMAGQGDEVAELAEDLTEELGKPVTEQEVIKLILEGNTNNVFCPSKKELFNRKDMVAYLKTRI